MMLANWYQDLMKRNWGVTAHFFICYFWAFGLVWLTTYLSVDLTYAFGSLITLCTYFVMITYEKNQYYDKKSKGKFKTYAKQDMIEDVIANHFGFFVGISSGLGVFYV